MKNLSQRGIAHVAIVAMVVVAVAVVGVAVAIGLKNRKTPSTSTNNQTTSNTVTPSPQDDNKKDETAVKAVAKAHFQLVYGKKADEAYDMTCKEFKDTTSRTSFKSGLESGGFYTIDLSGVEYTTVNIGNNQALLQAEVGPLQPNTQIQVKMLKKDGAWCILGYKTI